MNKDYPKGMVKTKQNENIFFDEDKLVAVNLSSNFLAVRTTSDFQGRGFNLSRTYNGVIVLDNSGNITLVPTKK